ncbi:hypothetical protein ABZT04_35610 [Streptomyces sp. NPDC005492]|uniref:hypothetical protein n=1 Tax=Streptomyces sp. NPDC005492 TaxID=3156883 RepID=UPI0033B59197
MPDARTHFGYRTDGLWAVAGIAFCVLVLGSGLALFGMLGFGEECMQGLTKGPGRLLHVRNQAFPPATVCEFRNGDVTSIGGGWALGLLLWAALVTMAGCLLVAMIAEFLDPRVDSARVVPMSPVTKLRRTGAAFLVSGSVFLTLYLLTGWKLLAGPSSACSTGADWGSQVPTTLDPGFFPPQATCRYTSGLTRQLNPDWVGSLTMATALPALLAGLGFALALRRWHAAQRGRVTPPSPGRVDATTG